MNAALAGLTFHPTANLNGNAASNINLVVDDLGHNGTGGNKTDSATVVIDRNGRMVGRAGGGDGDWTSEAARTLARSLLGARTASGPAPARTRHARKSVHLMTAVAPNDGEELG